MKIYTKFGDQGQSALFDGTRIPKDHLRLQTYGTLDELNSSLGLAIAQCNHPPLKTLLLQLQHQLFTLGSDLATPLDSKNANKIHRVGTPEITFLEQEIDKATEQLPPLKNFILPGGSLTAAQLHVARTIARRAERHLVSLMQQENIGNQPIIYLNRLSDLLFTLARLANKLDGFPDVEWDANK